MSMCLHLKNVIASWFSLNILTVGGGHILVEGPYCLTVE